MMLVLTLFLLASAPAEASARCAVGDPASYSDTNRLVWDPRFKPAVRCFLGNRRADYLYSGDTVANQMIAVLGGPPDAPVSIGSLFRFTACRHHSCTEKGAAVLKQDGSIIALGILHSACGRNGAPDDCAVHNTLTILLRRDNGQQTVIEDLSDWARNEVASEYQSPYLPSNVFDGVEVIYIAP